ncbi:hypothetical protein SAMN05444157_1191 [Frankineae bacterium MT45]|nr:hypothetical protein SAMN05444157_1191 [Frankineae bacterium MT45]
MNVTDLGTALVRRRGYAIAVVIVAILAAAYSWSNASALRQTSTDLLITPPAFSSGPGDVVDQNPMLNINSNVAQLASALATTMQSEAVASDLVQAGASGGFTVSNVSSDNPNTATITAQIHFVVTGDDADSTLKSANLIVAEAKKQLAKLQSDSNAPAKSHATLSMLSAPGTPTLVKSTRLRASGGLAAIIIIVGFVIIIIVDARLVARATRLRHRTSQRPPTATFSGPALATTGDGSANGHPKQPSEKAATETGDETPVNDPLR